MTKMIVLLALGGVASAAPKLECKVAKPAQKKRVAALRDEKATDAFYLYAVKLGGEPTSCEGRAGKGDFDSALTFKWKDGSSLAFELSQPENGLRMYRSAAPITDTAGVKALLTKEVEGVDWKKHDDDKDKGEVTERYFVPDTNSQAFFIKRGTALVGFGDSFAE